MVVDDSHILHDLVPAVFIGEVAAFTLGPAVSAMVVTVYDETSRDRRMGEAFVTPDVFAKSVEHLNNARGVSVGRPGLQRNPVAVIRYEDAVVVV
jgi:hypothetical protein